MGNPPPLNLCHVEKHSLIINRWYMFLNLIALALLIYYRTCSLLHLIQTRDHQSLLPHLLIFASELTLSLFWILGQPFLWRPVSRTVFPERLPGGEKLPAIDVFICTADPNREPPIGAMNTVISAMALDYPPDKLFVYLSDDAGSSVTLKAIKEAWRFAKLWVPFCRKYGVKTICPKAYFSAEEGALGNIEFIAEKEKIENEYDVFSERVIKITKSESSIVSGDHSPVVEVIDHKSTDSPGELQMPLLVYVAREKRHSKPHHFKAGALNTLLRVSCLISKSPYILGLDCDMYCNDPNSARQAMCFHLDPELSPSLAFVQFPQRFHNISKKDIYESQLTYTFKILWPGLDGLKGPSMVGTGYYMKREALYGVPSMQQETDLMKLKQRFGSSNGFIKALYQKYNPGMAFRKDFSTSLLQETHLLASCTYENDTKWGKEVGFRYFSVVEDIFTSFNLHCNGWVSVYFDPPRPAFLGIGVTSLNDALVQGSRWCTGLIEVFLSRFCPLIYGPTRMSILQSICYGWMALSPLCSLPSWALATLPQLCLFNGIPLYPEVKSSFSLVFVLIFLLSNAKHMQEVFTTGGSLQRWRYEKRMRMRMMRTVTTNLYGTIHAIMEKIGTKEASFWLTSKVVVEEQVKFYEMGKLNFQTSAMILVPLCSIVILNLAALVVGLATMVWTRDCSKMFIQVFLCFFVVAINCPIIEGMLVRTDKGRIPLHVTCLSVVFSTVLLSVGSFVLMY